MKLKLFITALHAVAFAILLAVSPAGSGSMVLMGAGKPAAAASGSCSESTQALNRLSGLSGTETSAIDAMICGMVTDGDWSSFTVFYFHGLNSSASGTTNLVSSSYTATVNGTCTFTADRGFACNGSTGYLDTTFTPSGGGNFTQNSASALVYILTDRTSGNNSVAFGAYNGSGDFVLQALNASSQLVSELNGATYQTVGGRTTTKGLFTVSRTSSSLVSTYQNNLGVIITSASDTSLSNVTNSIYLAADNLSGTPSLLSTDQFMVSAFGAGLASAAVTRVHARINTAVTAICSCNVY